MGSPNLIAAAVEYMRAGLTVMPLTGKSPAKVPGITVWPQMGGPVETKEDYDFVLSVFDADGVTGIAIIIPPGMAVVDIDGEEGAEVLRDMLGTTDVSKTAAATTGRGLHLYYMTMGEVRTTKLGEKLDLKGVGGYVAAPPSIHPSGAIYEWLDPLVVAGLVSVNFLPEPIMKLLAERAFEASLTVRRGPYMEVVYDDARGFFSTVEKPASMLGLIKTMEGAKEGERNNVANWAFWKAREDGVPYDDAMKVLGPAAEGVGLSLQEIRQTARSAYRGSRG